MSAEGKVFYINHNDKTTHWTRPDPPPVQPDDSPAEDLPPSGALTSTGSGKDHDPFPTNGSADAGASPALPGGSNGGYGSARPYGDEEAVAPEGDEEAEEEEARPEVSRAVAAAVETEAEVEAVTLEEVAGASVESTAVDIDPRMAPSATVVAETAEEEESTARSMGGSAATAFARGTEEAGASLEAATSRSGGGDTTTASAAAAAAAATGEEGGEEGAGGGEGGGPVSSIVKSGLFGATVARPGGSEPVQAGTSGSNGDAARSVAKRSNSAVPNYASSATGALKTPANVAAGGARAVETPKPGPEVDALPEGASWRILWGFCLRSKFIWFIFVCGGVHPSRQVARRY